MVTIGYLGLSSLYGGALRGIVFEKHADGVHLGMGGVFGVFFFCLLSQH